MVLPEFVKEHPAISILTVLGILAGLGGLAVIYSQATLVDGSGDPCSWQEAANPDTGQAFESEQAFKDYVQENGGTVPEGMKFEYRSGDLYFKTPCGVVGGGSTQ